LQDGFGIHEPEILDGCDGVLRTMPAASASVAIVAV
jgi:hypothetical protein